MLPLEHSALLLTCIKQFLVLKTIFGLFESGRFTQVLLYTSTWAYIREFGTYCIATTLIDSTSIEPGTLYINSYILDGTRLFLSSYLLVKLDQGLGKRDWSADLFIISDFIKTYDHDASH